MNKSIITKIFIILALKTTANTLTTLLAIKDNPAPGAGKCMDDINNSITAINLALEANDDQKASATVDILDKTIVSGCDAKVINGTCFGEVRTSIDISKKAIQLLLDGKKSGTFDQKKYDKLRITFNAQSLKMTNDCPKGDAIACYVEIQLIINSLLENIKSGNEDSFYTNVEQFGKTVTKCKSEVNLQCSDSLDGSYTAVEKFFKLKKEGASENDQEVQEEVFYIDIMNAWVICR